jgi:hypothetical protein
MEAAKVLSCAPAALDLSPGCYTRWFIATGEERGFPYLPSSAWVIDRLLEHLRSGKS